MPRSGVNGTYTLPPNTDNQQPLTPISSSMFNSAMDDVEQTFNTPTPIAYGGTGAADAVTARSNLGLNLYDSAGSLTAAQQGQARANIGAGILAGFRNKLINGAFEVNQRLAPSAIPSLGIAYTLDRWRVYNGTDQPMVVSQQTRVMGFDPATVAPGTPLTALKINFAVAPTTGVVVFGQPIEGVETLAGGTVTGTIYPSPNVGPVDFVVKQNFGVGGSSEVQPISQPMTPKGTDRKVTTAATLPSINGKTVGVADYLAVEFHFTPRAVGDYVFDRASFVEGDATAEHDPFAPRHIQQERALCQWYYEQWTASLGRVRLGTMASINATDGIIQGRCSPKRAAPTISAFGTWRTLGGNLGGAVTLSALQGSADGGFQAGGTTAGGTTAGFANVVESSDAADATIIFDSEF